MNWKTEGRKLAVAVAVFVLFFWLPVEWPRFSNGIDEALGLARWYAREHVILCLVPALFIAGAIGVFVSNASVMKYLGAGANKALAYGVAAVSGTILAVCSCTVLPLFGGIYKMGAGLGPACAFLYAGPAINVLAIVLTARILGLELGIARAVGAVGFSVLIGLAMHFLFRKEELARVEARADTSEAEASRPLWKNAIFFAILVGILVFANWPASVGPVKWTLTSALGGALGLVLVFWFGVRWWKVALAAIPAVALALLLPSGGLWVLLPFSAGAAGLAAVLGSREGEAREWLSSTWIFSKQIVPLLFMGVLVAGFLLGGPGGEGVIPARWVRILVGAAPDTFLSASGLGGGTFAPAVRTIWPLWTNLFASLFGAFMYFATLTEVPILQGLISSGMGKGPALSLLLAGPAVSLPSMLVMARLMGVRKTVTFALLVIVAATVAGMIFGEVCG